MRSMYSLQSVLVAVTLFLATSEALATMNTKGCKKDTLSSHSPSTTSTKPNSSTPAALNSSTTVADSVAMGSTDRSTDPACFPGDATVFLESGVLRKIRDLFIGDRIYTGNGDYSTVFMFTHKLEESTSTFLRLTTSSGTSLKITEGPYLYVNGNLTPAKHVVTGDVLELANDWMDTVEHVAEVRITGLYNPQTSNGMIAVSGILASNYTTAVEPAFAHASLTPLRAMYRTIGLSASIESDVPTAVLSIFSKPLEEF